MQRFYEIGKKLKKNMYLPQKICVFGLSFVKFASAFLH